MKIKVDELSGIKLDYYVAVANNVTDIKYTLLDNKLVSVEVRKLLLHCYYNQYNPTSNWHIAGKIIEDNNITLELCYNDYNQMYYMSVIDVNKFTPDYTCHVSSGDTRLEAAMRCFVKSKLGDEVEDIE